MPGPAARCPVCGVPHAQCGPRVAAATRPADLVEEALTMPATARYRVTLPDGRKVVLKLSDADADRLNAEPLDAPPAPAKARRPPNKARTARNKARTARDKAT